MRKIAWCLLAATLTACGGAVSPSVLRQAQDDKAGPPPSKSPIQHVVLIIQENRTFNDFFATFKGADGTTTGQAEPNSQCGITQAETIPLKPSNLITKLNGKPQDLSHAYSDYDTARDGGKMDGFDAVLFGDGQPECTFPYQYTKPSQIKPYWDMAEQYTLAEHMFTTQGSSSFTAHQDLIAGDAVIKPNESLVDLPTDSREVGLRLRQGNGNVADHEGQRLRKTGRPVSLSHVSDAAQSARREEGLVAILRPADVLRRLW